MKIIKLACALVSIYIIFHFLSVAKAQIIPLALAGTICFLIIEIADFYASISIKSFKMPGWLSMLLAMVTIVLVLFLFVIIINQNIQEVIKVAPSYQEKLVNIIEPMLKKVGVGDISELKETIKSMDVKKYLSSLTVLAKNITSNVGMIFIYSLFILLGFRTDKKKLGLVLEEGKFLGIVFEKEKVENILKDINGDIRKYIVIKGGASFATGALSFLVLSVLGVDFAPFWAMLIFLLNFIPTIGSIAAIIPPIILSLVQFGFSQAFFGVFLGLVLIQVAIGNVLEPRIAGNSLNLDPKVIIFSLVLWGYILGIVGMFLCVPITVILNIILANFETTKCVAIMLSANGSIIKEKS